MRIVHYISRKPNPVAANKTHYDEQFVVAKLDLEKRTAKRFLLNKSNYESVKPESEVNYKPNPKKKPKMPTRMLILRRQQKALKQFMQICNLTPNFYPSKGMNKLTANSQQNLSANLIAQIQSRYPSVYF